MKNKTENILRDEVTIISSGVTLEGKLTSDGNIRVDGTVNGNVYAKGNVTVGEHGEINGEVIASHINLGGKLVGKVTAKEKLILESKAVLKGDLVSKILVIEAGAVFEGNSSMGVKEAANKPALASA